MEGYEYYAFQFLSQWYEDELALHKAITANPTEADVRKALLYFGVSRTFHGINEPGNLAFIVHSLQMVCTDSSVSSPEAKVNELARLLKSKFGQFNLSAASKLLWLSCKYPFIVYDSRATRALKAKYKHADASYDEYVNAWRSEFTKHKEQIINAVKALPKSRPFMRANQTSDEDLLKMVHEPWFLKRVFDMLLWDVGKPSRA